MIKDAVKYHFDDDKLPKFVYVQLHKGCGHESMKLPGGVSTRELIKLLKRLGFKVIKQHGNHVGLKYKEPS